MVVLLHGVKGFTVSEPKCNETAYLHFIVKKRLVYLVRKFTAATHKKERKRERKRDLSARHRQKVTKIDILKENSKFLLESVVFEKLFVYNKV